VNLDKRQYAPATERNRQPILEVLSRILPKSGNILELASGTGEHAVFFAPKFAPRQWIPSDPNPVLRDSINAWREIFPAENLHPARNIDVLEDIWPVEAELAIEAIVNINMIHISPWLACLGLMAGAGLILPPGGILYLYGPFKIAGEHTAPSNAAFDRSLRSQHPEWGVRDLDDVIAAAKDRGLEFQEKIAMPANNFSVVFQKK
jgi:hypothetical protein